MAVTIVPQSFPDDSSTHTTENKRRYKRNPSITSRQLHEMVDETMLLDPRLVVFGRMQVLQKLLIFSLSAKPSF